MEKGDIKTLPKLKKGTRNGNKQLLVNLLAKYSIMEFITGLYLSIEANDDVINNLCVLSHY